MAAITNLATLKTAIADYMARDDIMDYLDYFVQVGEAKLYRSLNLRNEETALSVAISSGVAAVPSDFKALKFAYYDQNPVYHLSWVPVEQLYMKYPDRSGADYPKYISREGSNFIFGPVAADGTLKGIYYAKQDSILTTDPSWYVTNAPDALLFAACEQAALFIKDWPQAAEWNGRLMAVVDSLEDEQDNAEHSFGVLQARA